MSSPVSLPSPDSPEFNIEYYVKEYLTEYGNGFYEDHKQKIKQLFNESLTNNETRNELIERLASLSYDEKSRFILPKKIKTINDLISSKPTTKHGGGPDDLTPGWGSEERYGDEDEIAINVMLIVGILLAVYGGGRNWIFGGSKHKKRKGRKSKKTKKSRKHKKGRKSKKAKKSMKKRKSMKKKKSKKKRK